jgi:hypothetical protein
MQKANRRGDTGDEIEESRPRHGSAVGISVT